MWQKLSKCYPPHLEIIPLFLLAFTVYLALSNYATLPDTIPTHFNAQGIADGWGGKSTVFVFLGLNAFIYILFTAINIAFAVVRDPRSMINLPAARKAALSDAQVETLRVTLNRYLFLMKLLTQGLTAYLLYATIEVAWERADGLGALSFLFIAGILAVAGLMLWKALRLTQTPKQTEY